MRSSEEIWQRFRKHAKTTIHGHPACAKRLAKTSGFKELDPGRATLPAGITAHLIGKPSRYETPLHVPSHKALVFGDAVAEIDGRLVVWATDRVDAKMERFHRERFNPTLEPLLELDFDRVLVTHGQPIRKGGRAGRSATRSTAVPGTTAARLRAMTITVNGIEELKALAGPDDRPERMARGHPGRHRHLRRALRATTSGSTSTWSAPRPRARSAPRSPTAT